MRGRRAFAVACGSLIVVGLAAPGAAVLANPLAGLRPVDADRPNIVVLMVDDLTADLVGYMGEVRRLQDESVTFDSYFVSNSLCCPSRATFMSGKYPHNSKVRANAWPKGGFARFLQNDLTTSVGPYLAGAGYRTGLIGKYLNGYLPEGDTDGVRPPDYPAEFVPPGWDEWWVTGEGYQQFDYEVVDSVDGVTRVVEYEGGLEEHYLTDVMSTRADEFIERAAEDSSRPFFLTLTPFSVHHNVNNDPQQPGPRFPPAPRDRPDSPDRPSGWTEPEFSRGDCGSPVDGGCDDVAFPDPSWGSFNQTITDPPNHAPTEPFTDGRVEAFRARHLERVQMAQAVDDLLGDVRDSLDAAGVAERTYVVFTSDNGYHLGEHALVAGKGTAYDHDVRVPLIVAPPGGTVSRTQGEIVQNTDLLPTLLDLAGVALPVDLDGASLVPLLAGAPTTWRATALIEHVRSDPGVPFSVDPDRVSNQGDLPGYVALRTDEHLYVDYSDLDSVPPRPGRAEYFDVGADPSMLHNLFRTLPKHVRAELNSKALAYAACAGSACWDVGLDPPRTSGPAPSAAPLELGGP